MINQVKLHNQNRINKHQTYSMYGKCCNPRTDSSSLLQVQKFVWNRKFHYQYDPKNDPQILKQIKQQFEHNIEKKFQNGNKLRSKGLGRKEKYERNLETGKFLKPNPIMISFNKIDQKLKIKQKQFAFDILKYLFRRNKLN